MDFTKEIRHDTYDFVKPEQFDLQGKAVLITGASKGVRQISHRTIFKAQANFATRSVARQQSASQKQAPHILL